MSATVFTVTPVSDRLRFISPAVVVVATQNPLGEVSVP